MGKNVIGAKIKMFCFRVLFLFVFGVYFKKLSSPLEYCLSNLDPVNFNLILW